MNYIFYKYQGLIIIAFIPIGTAILMLCLFILGTAYNKLSDSGAINAKYSSVLTTAVIILSVIISLGSLYLFYLRFVHGAIQFSYIVTKGNEQRLVVWLTRVHTAAGISEQYNQRYISFDIDMGDMIGWKEVVKSDPINDYWIYGPFGTNLWGYSEKSGVLLLDLFQPGIVADDSDILEHNPELKPVIKLAPGRYNQIYHRETHSLAISTARGNVYWVDPGLNIQSAKEPPRPRPRHHEGSTVILRPWNETRQVSDKQWVSISDCVLSYVDRQGKELNRLDLCELFNPETRPYTILHRGSNILILVTREWRTLSALRTDAETGRVLDTINYFR